MKFAFVISVLAFASIKSTEAACANQCSGHGRCTNYKATTSSSPTNIYQPQTAGGTVNALGYDTSLSKKDSCTCFLRNEDGVEVYDYTNPDCSGKTCPSGASFAGLPNAGDDHGQVVECSGVGICDRQTGTCNCEPGFSGKACSRRTCPNDCSGRGQCRLLSEIVDEVVAMNSNLPWTSSGITYTGFDKLQSAGCICDKGFKGPDCSIVECPSTSDPMGGKGSESGRACSGRGKCDESRGTCTCYPGYHGTACEQQLVNMG